MVYNSLLAGKRKRLHGEIGMGMEELYNDRLPDHYESLAHHYFESENYEKSAEYSRLAASKALKAASLFKAISFTEQRIACLEKLPMTEEVQKILIDARTGLGLYLIQWDQNEARKAIDPIIDLAIKLDYKRRLGQIYVILGAHYCVVKEDYQEASKALEYALTLFGETGDTVSAISARYFLAATLAAKGEFERSARYFQETYEMNLAAGSLWGASTMLSTFTLNCLFVQGKIEQAFQTSEKSLVLAERSGDAYSRGTVYLIHGISFFFRGLFEEAEKYLLKGLEFSSFIAFAFHAPGLIHLGQCYGERGDYGKSKVCYEKAISLLSEKGLCPSYQNLGQILLLRARVMNQEKNLDLFSMQSAAEALRPGRWTGWALGCVGDIFLHMDDRHREEAGHWLSQAIEVSERNGTFIFLGWAQASYAELCRQNGDPSGAREHLGKAIEIMQNCGADGWVAKYQRTFETLSLT